MLLSKSRFWVQKIFQCFEPPITTTPSLHPPSLLPHFYQVLLVGSWSFVILPEFVDLDVADGDDENEATEDEENEYSAKLENFPFTSGKWQFSITLSDGLLAC